MLLAWTNHEVEERRVAEEAYLVKEILLGRSKPKYLRNYDSNRSAFTDDDGYRSEKCQRSRHKCQ